MGEYRYEIPDTPVMSQWERLSGEAQGVLAGSALESSTAGTLAHERMLSNLEPSIYKWFESGAEAALQKWTDYVGKDSQIQELPTAEELLQNIPDTTITRLFQAQQTFSMSNLRSPQGEYVGDSMELVLIPWQHYLNNLPNIHNWLRNTRLDRGNNSDLDGLNAQLRSDIQSSLGAIYHDPYNKGEFTTTRGYLQDKINHDGPWGVMLMQAGNDSGLKDHQGRSPNDLNKNGFYQQFGLRVDNMGIFEWWALTLQQRGQYKFASSWLMANIALASMLPITTDTYDIASKSHMYELLVSPQDTADPDTHLRLAVA